ncbi:uncharacterized protein JCM6883_000784 [Sporobolomyces salmoneus]|uniref:uncharacterized protein n=1 Tax=Sporobolomyces salmoneus TaxID=183962 RepID=UPI00316E6E10
MYHHSRSLSDDVLNLPSTLATSVPLSSSPVYSTSYPESTFPPPLHLSSSSLFRARLPSASPTPYFPHYSTQPPSSVYNSSSTLNGGRRDLCEFKVESGSSSDVVTRTSAFGRPITSHEERYGDKGEGGGLVERDGGTITISQEEEESRETAMEWYSRTFGGSFGTLEQHYAEEEEEQGRECEDYSGGTESDQAQAQNQTFAFSTFDNDNNDPSPIISPLEYEPFDFSLTSDQPVSNGHDWISTSSTCPPRANYSMESPSISPVSPRRTFSTFSSSIGNNDSFSPHRVRPNNNVFPSFAAASNSLVQSPPAPVALRPQPSNSFFLPASPQHDASSPTRRGGLETNGQAQSIFHSEPHHSHADPVPTQDGGGGVAESPNQSRRASTLGFNFPSPPPFIENRRQSCPAPAQLGPLSSPQLVSLPCPSPNFLLDAPTPAVVDSSRFELLPPPFKPSLIDLPPLPSPTPQELTLPVPPSIPASPPASGPVRRSHSQSKKRRSSFSSSSSSSHSPSFSPTSNSDTSTNDTVLLEQDEEEEEEVPKVLAQEERISPITGKPTKVISKRSWPPKDAALRRYSCTIQGCRKSFGRPSALNTHMRTHDGKKPYECPIPTCSRPFSVFSNLKRHMVIHPSVDFTSVTVNDLALIHWVVDEKDPGGDGGRLEWIDQIPAGSA